MQAGVRFAVALLALALPRAALAQANEKEIELTREAIRAEHKLLVSQNLSLNEAQSEAFWPVYDEYAKEITRVNDRRITLLETFGEDYGAIDDAQAASMLEEALSIRQARLDVQKTFLERFGKALPATRVARFYQIESKLDAVVDFELARAVPLVR